MTNETETHIHQWGQWSPWTKVGFDRWHRQRDCMTSECGMVEDDTTSSPRVAGEPPPTGTTYADSEDDEEAYKAAIEVPTPTRPHLEDMETRTAFDSSADKYLEMPKSLDLLDGDPLHTAYIRAIEVVRLLKKTIDDREVQRNKFRELLQESGLVDPSALP